MESFETYIDLVEIEMDANGASKEETIDLDDGYTHIVGISSNSPSAQTAVFEDVSLDRKEVLFKSGVSVEDTVATHPVASPIDRFFPCELAIKDGLKFRIKVKDTTPVADFVAHTRKFYLLLVKK